MRSCPPPTIFPRVAWPSSTLAWAVCAAAAFAALAGPASVSAQQGSERLISVTGHGTIKVRPDMVEIRGTLKGAAPIAADAMKKFRQHRDRLEESLANLKIPDLKVEFGGASIIAGNAMQQQQAMMMGMAEDTTNTPSNLTVSEPVKLQLVNVSKSNADQIFTSVLKIVDAAKDNGLQLSEPVNQMMAMQFGQGLESNLATFVINDQAKLRRDAMAAALTNAKTRAADLAKLAGAELGTVRRIKEVSLSTKTNSETGESLMMRIYGIEDSKPAHEFSSPNFGEIEVIAKLEVDYTIQ